MSTFALSGVQLSAFHHDRSVSYVTKLQRVTGMSGRQL